MHQAGADVQYVILPVNGKWYDHLGIHRSTREPVYKKYIKLLSHMVGKCMICQIKTMKNMY